MDRIQSARSHETQNRHLSQHSYCAIQYYIELQRADMPGASTRQYLQSRLLDRPRSYLHDHLHDLRESCHYPSYGRCHSLEHDQHGDFQTFAPQHSKLPYR